MDARCTGGLLPWGTHCLPNLHLTEAQHAVARIVGGGTPETDLEREIWGFTGPIEPWMRALVALRLGRRGFKTTLAAWVALHAAMTCDLSGAGGGADVVVPICAPSEPGTRLALNMAVHLATNGPLRDCINTKQHEEGRRRQAVTARSLHLVRPCDGREVEIRSVVASPGGKNLVGFHVPALVLDEAERFRADSEAGITDAEQLDAAMPALLPGGQALLISTPYDLDSYMHKHVEKNHGHPVDGIAAVATTRKLRTDSPTVLAMVERELLRNPNIALRDYECIPIGRDDAYFDVLLVNGRTVESTQRTGYQVSSAVDLAFIRDGCALVILERQGDRLVQVYERFIEPTKSAPLRPSLVRDEFKNTLLAHNSRVCAADVHEFSSWCETAIPSGIQVTHAPTSTAGTTAFGLTRDLLRWGRLDVLPETARQLKSVRTGNDGSPKVPREPGTGHADLVSALVAAVWLDRRHGSFDGGSQQRPQTLRGGFRS